MKVLICINNNLKYDTRVKRHALAIAARGHHVHVAACAVTDAEFALKESNITYTMSSYVPGEHPINGKILEFAKEYGLEQIFLESFPILACQSYYYEPSIEQYTAVLDRYVSGGRWSDITSRCSEQMTLSEAMCYPLCFFERTVLYAKDVLKQPADVVLCNDLDTLLAGVVHKKKYHSRLIYDIHDMSADLSEYVFPQMYSNVLALFEKKMIPYADAVMSISKSLLIWSKQHYGFEAPMFYMPNCSAYCLTKQEACKKKIGKKIRIYYHGMCDSSRGLKELLQAVKSIGGGYFAVVLRCLPSPYLDEIKRMVLDMHMESDVTFYEPVSPEQILSDARRDGDIGFAFCQADQCLNWRFALQNKFIEYAKAGLPVITSDTKEQGSIVKKYKNGWVLQKNTVQGITDVLHKILQEQKNLYKVSKRAWRCADRLFQWDIYENRLNGLIENSKKVSRHRISCKIDMQKLNQWEAEDARHIQETEF